jgi:hypothetical protein
VASEGSDEAVPPCRAERRRREHGIGWASIFIFRIKPHPWDDVLCFVAELEKAATSPDPHGTREIFARFVPEYQPASLRSAAPPSPQPRASASRVSPAPAVAQSIVATES